MRVIIKPGDKFHKLEVLERSGVKALCRCKCGKVKWMFAQSLRIGKARTCGGKGCRTSRKHGGHGSHLYEVWHGIRARCLNPKSKDYPRYGGRGIDIDPRWNDFAVFAADVGEPAAEGLTIDRIDNARGYWPGNVRWATDREQSNNRSTNVYLEFGGKRLTLAQWSEETGVGITTLHYRLTAGWSVERMLTTPARGHGK